MTHRIALLALSLALLSPAAHAQFGNPAGMTPNHVEAQPGVPAPGQPNITDRLFVKLISMGNAGEIELGKLAQGRAGASSVKGFAQKMAQDHTSSGNRLAAVAKQLNLPVPAQPDPDQAATRRRLEGLQGAAFDAAYLQAQLVDHQKTIQLLQWEISNGQEAALQAFAKDTLPVVTEHLRMTQDLLSEVTATGPQGLGAVDEQAARRRQADNKP
jgi:putative membrane protein